jgi:hypothetical protein
MQTPVSAFGREYFSNRSLSRDWRWTLGFLARSLRNRQPRAVRTLATKS